MVTLTVQVSSLCALQDFYKVQSVYKCYNNMEIDIMCRIQLFYSVTYSAIPLFHIPYFKGSQK